MEAINRVGNFTIALINDTSVAVKKARSNHRNTDFTKPLILIDNLGNAQKIGTSDEFNGDDEITKFNDFYKQTFTFDFYGTTAYDLATKFIAQLRTQTSYDLQKERSLTIYRPTQITRLNQLVGTENFNRYQIECEISYSDNTDLATLRIDYANYELTLVESSNKQSIINLEDNYINFEGDLLLSTADYMLMTNDGYLINAK